jgi:hypothetical protein
MPANHAEADYRAANVGTMGVADHAAPKRSRAGSPSRAADPFVDA